MSKRVRYNGPSCTLGRHGKVKFGAILTLTESELRSVKRDGQFSVIDGQKSTAEPIELRDTTHFQFTRLKWGTPLVFREIRRLGRKQLASAAAGLESLGVGAAVSQDMTREQMAEVIIEAAQRAGWIDE